MSEEKASLAGAGLAGARLVGSWRLVRYTLQKPGGEILMPLGEKPEGILFYGAAGDMACNLANPDTPFLSPPDEAMDGDGWRARISYTTFSGYFGRWEVEGALVHHHVEAALMPGWAGTTVTRRYVFEGENRLLLSATAAGGLKAALLWERCGA